jgi:protein-disulfide isomerase
MENATEARLTVPVGPEDHVRGPADAKITLVEYGDFECPYCGVAAKMVHELEQKYPKDLKVVFRSFPLEQHPHAEAAAEAAEFAADFDKFWDLHDVLYAHQKALTRDDLGKYASQLGLDADELASALDDGRYRPIVDEMKEGGEESGIPGTPAFFLNDLLFEDEPTLENFTHAIDYLLKHGTAD